MKNGFVNIEFMVSVFVFLVTIGFILLNIAGNLVPLHRDTALDIMRSKTYQLSQVIIFDEGDPKNWDENDVNRAGLSTGEKYVISAAKITSFNSTCANNYDKLRDMFFGNRRFQIRINATDSSGKTVIDCGNLTSPLFSLKRPAVLDTTREIVEIEISVR